MTVEIDSETYELRRLLDERGAEYETCDEPSMWYTCWRLAGDDMMNACFEEIDGLVPSFYIRYATPAQAVAATLGRGTCKLTQASWDDGTCTWGCICSACDAHLEHETGIGYNFCPICGAKVVNDG